MGKIDLGQAISILANVGVIAGIVFLALELQQNNQSLALQSRLDREALFLEGVARRLENPDLFRVTAKLDRGDTLSDEEQLLLDWENHALLVDFMVVYMRVHDGLLDEDTIPLELWRLSYRDIWPGLPEFWSRSKQRYRPEFVQWFERNVVNDD